MICREVVRGTAPLGQGLGSATREEGRSSGRTGRRALAMGLAALAMLASTGIQAADDDDGSLEGDWSQKFTDKMKDSFGSAASKIGLGRPPGPPPAEAPSGCPTISLLPGTEVQRVMAPGQSDNQGVRYQYSLFTVGRECALSGGRVTLRIGANGRVLLGPAGAAGRFDIPIRVAVFDELQHKVVESRLFKIAATIPAGQSGAPFAFVSDAMTLSIASGRSRDYSIKVGIDTNAKGGTSEGTKPKRASRRTPAATESASR